MSVVERLLIALFTGGHLLLQGMPGLAKTLLVNCLARAIDLQFSRVQFTIDLLPSDIVGSEILDQRKGEFRTHQGPVFTNLLLADEINRAAPKVQSALLEAMQERRVTIGNNTLPLPAPFLVIATQNPIEQSGTFELPEAQLDRFLLCHRLDYPSVAEEEEVLRRQLALGLRRDEKGAVPKTSFDLLERTARRDGRGTRRGDGGGAGGPRERGFHEARGRTGAAHAAASVHRNRRQPARRHRAGAGGARPRLHSRARLRGAGRSVRAGRGRAAAPHAPDLRSARRRACTAATVLRGILAEVG